jgi:hypothetical protein
MLDASTAPIGNLTQAKAPDTTVLAQFATYLRSGRMPLLSSTSGTALHLQMLEVILREHGEQLARVLREMHSAGHAQVMVQRLVQQFPVAQLVRILRALTPQHSAWLLDSLDALELLPLQASSRSMNDQMQVFWGQVLHAVLAQADIEPPQLMQVILSSSAAQLKIDTEQLHRVLSESAPVFTSVGTPMTPALTEQILVRLSETELLAYCQELRAGTQLMGSELSVPTMQRLIRGLLGASTDLSSQQRTQRIAAIFQGAYEGTQPKQFYHDELLQLIARYPKQASPMHSPAPEMLDARSADDGVVSAIDAADLTTRLREALRTSTPELMRFLVQFSKHPALLAELGLRREEYVQLVRAHLMSDPAVQPQARENLISAIQAQSLLAPSVGRFYASVLHQLLSHSDLDLDLATSSQTAFMDQAEGAEHSKPSSPAWSSPNGTEGDDNHTRSSTNPLEQRKDAQAEFVKPHFDIGTASTQELQRYCEQLRSSEPSFVTHAVQAEHRVKALQRLAGALLQSNAPQAEAHSNEFLDAIWATAGRSSQVPRFYHHVIEHLIANQAVDLEAILAQVEAPSARLGESTALVVPPRESAFPERMHQANIQARLVEALLQAKPSAIQAHWNMLLTQYSPMLRSALLQYARRPEIRQHLSVSFPIDMLLGMSEVLQPGAAHMLRTLYRHAELLRQMEPAHQRADASDWMRRLWEISFDELITVTSNTSTRSGPFDVEQHVATLFTRRSGGESQIVLEMQQLWRHMLRADELFQQLASNAASPNEPPSAVATAAPQLLLTVLCQQLGLAHVDFADALTRPPETLATPAPASLLDKLLHKDPQALERVFKALKARLHPIASAEAALLRSPGTHLTEVGMWPAPTWHQLSLAHIEVDTELTSESRQMLLTAIAEQATHADDAQHYHRAVFLQLLARRGLDLDAALLPLAHASGSGGVTSADGLGKRSTPMDTNLAESVDSSTQRLGLLALRQEALRLLNSVATGTTLMHAEKLRLADALSVLERSRAAATTAETSTEFSAQMRLCFSDAQRLQRVLVQLPQATLAQLLAYTHPDQHTLLLQCMNMVADAVSLLTQGAARQAIASAKWQALFEYVYVRVKPLQVPALARYVGDVLARACGINEVSQSEHLRSLVQRRLALLLPDSVPERTHKAGNKENAEPVLRSPTQLSEPKTVDFSEGTPLMNAGMVLAAPYLPRLFALVKLTADGQFVDFHAQERAAHLLQFMVMGNTERAEYQLLLNKLLCGIGTAIPVRPDIELTAHEKSVAEELLQGMIQNWNTIGKTSIGGLRETFLQRAGWVALQDDAWQLKVQTGTFDMLLDRLPWSFSIIKYGWMEKPVHVTWR